jgi:hypothetical protein
LVVFKSFFFFFFSQEVVVPRLFALLDAGQGGSAPVERGGGGEVAAALRAKDATRLLTHCITLEAEVPTDTWREGFRLVGARKGQQQRQHRQQSGN